MITPATPAAGGVVATLRDAITASVRELRRVRTLRAATAVALVLFVLAVPAAGLAVDEAILDATWAHWFGEAGASRAIFYAVTAVVAALGLVGALLVRGRAGGRSTMTIVLAAIACTGIVYVMAVVPLHLTASIRDLVDVADAVDMKPSGPPNNRYFVETQVLLDGTTSAWSGFVSLVMFVAAFAIPRFRNRLLFASMVVAVAATAACIAIGCAFAMYGMPATID